jgi:TonB family protein
MSTLSETPADPISRAIKISAGIHLGLLLVLFLKSIVLPSEPNTKEYIPSLRVDLVALPDQKTTEQITPAMPAVAPEEVKEAEKKEKVAQKTEEKGDYSLNKKKNKKERMKSALDRIKALEKIKDGEQIKGNKVMKGSSSKGQASDSVQTTYIDMVLDKVRNEWELPQWLKDQNLTAKVLIKIDRRGIITSTRFLKSSGNEQFDAAVKRTLQASVPFPAPPLSILADMSGDGIVFGFPIAE